METTFSFRLMNLEDIGPDFRVEHESFTLPWSREAFYNELYKINLHLYCIRS